MKQAIAIIASLLVLGWLVVSPALAQDLVVDDVARELTCQCGCGSVLNNCVHQECGSRSQMTAIIEQQIAQGKSKSEIVQFFVASYGEVVLAAPTKRGFNLTAWVTPFVALVAGGVLVSFLLRLWVFRGRQPATIAIAHEARPAAEEEYRRRLEKELEEYKGGFE